MRKLVSLLLSIGILSGAFIGCGINNQKEISDNENSSNISNEEKNNKEELINFILPELKKEINLNKYKVK